MTVYNDGNFMHVFEQTTKIKIKEENSNKYFPVFPHNCCKLPRIFPNII